MEHDEVTAPAWTWKGGALLAVGVVALLMTVALGSTQVRAAPRLGGPSNVEEFGADLSQRIVSLMDRYAVAGVAVALVEDGEVAWVQAYGHADLATGQPLTVDAVNRAESISKSLTAWGVMTLVEEDRLRLDDPVSMYLGDWQFPAGQDGADISVRQLLSHTGGVAQGPIGETYDPESDVPSLEESVAAGFALVDDPGSGFRYSNSGYNLLEILIENLTGQAFSDYMRTAVLEPLGMRSASFAWDEQIRGLVPMGYDLDGAPVPPYVYPEKASGGLFATVEDIGRFVAAGMTGAFFQDRGVLEEASIRTLHSATADISGLFRFVSESYGLGHFVETLAPGGTAVWHGGQGNGWMTHFHSVPASGDGIVIMTNSQRSWPVIARVLEDWTQWKELGPVGMAVITRVDAAAWIAIALIVVVVAWLLLRVGRGLVSGRRRVAPFSGHAALWRGVQGMAALLLAAGLVWAATRDYLFVWSVLPRAWPWLNLTLIGLAAALAASAMTAPTRRAETDTRWRDANEAK